MFKLIISIYEKQLQGDFGFIKIAEFCFFTLFVLQQDHLCEINVSSSISAACFFQALWNRSFIKCNAVIPCHILKPALEFVNSFALYNSVMLVAYLKSRIRTLQVMFEMNRRTRPDDFISNLYTSHGRRLFELAYKLLRAGHTSLSTLAECEQTVGSW